MMIKKVLVLDGQAKNLLNFRGDLIEKMVKHGCEVIGCSVEQDSEVEEGLLRMGASYLQLPMNRTGLNPFKDFSYFIKLYKVMKREKPDVILSFTVKPVIYGSFAAFFARVPLVSSIITGLGYAFIKPKEKSVKHFLINNIVKRLYRTALSFNHKVFFQNPDDKDLFVEQRFVRKERVVLVNGSGVNLKRFERTDIPLKPIFLVVARLLKDKGIYEYVEAASRLKLKYPYAKFRLVGGFDVNPASVSREQMSIWQDEGAIEYLGELPDVRLAMSSAQVHVLPSYREGTPRSILEAMAVGRAIITTDVPGCRETVEDGKNGFLIPDKNVDALVSSMEKFILEPKLAVEMGEASRLLVESKFDVHLVNHVIISSLGIDGEAGGKA